MRKLLAIACASLACACAVALAACGGASSNPAGNYVGEWKLGAVEANGMTIAGDFEQGILGQSMAVTVVLNEDKTGSITYNDESIDLSWELADDDSISITSGESSAEQLEELGNALEGIMGSSSTVESGENNAIKATSDGKTLKIEYSSSDSQGSMLFSTDGSIEGARQISDENAEAITDTGAAMGTWKLAGVSFSGMSIYGDTDTLASLTGESTDTTVTFNDDGSATFFGQDTTWASDVNGLSIAQDNTMVPVKSIDGDLYIDLSSATSSLGLNMAILLTK